MKYRRWVLIGRLSAIVLARPHRDNRPTLVREADLAAAFRLSRGTLRNYRDAVTLVRKVPDGDIRRRLYAMSAASAAAMARWLSRSPWAAADFLAKRPGAGPGEIIDAEKESNDLTTAGTRRRVDHFSAYLAEEQQGFMMLNRNISEALYSQRRLHWQAPIALLHGKISRAVSELDRFYRLDHLAPLVPLSRSGSNLDEIDQFHAASGGVQAAIIEIAAYNLLQQYEVEARSIWARAVAASTRFPLVVVLFPGPAARRRFLGALPGELGHKSEDVPTTIVKGRARQQEVLFAAPSLGALLFTTRLHAALDLFGEDAHRRYGALY